MDKHNRLEQMATRLASLMAELEPYGDVPGAEEYAESLKSDPLATVETLIDILEGLMA